MMANAMKETNSGEARHEEALRSRWMNVAPSEDEKVHTRVSEKFSKSVETILFRFPFGRKERASTARSPSFGTAVRKCSISAQRSILCFFEWPEPSSQAEAGIKDRLISSLSNMESYLEEVELEFNC